MSDAQPPTTPATTAVEPVPHRRPWYRAVEGVLYGTAAAGMFFNLLSTTIGYRGVAVPRY